MPARLDPGGWQTATRELRATLERIERVAVSAKSRLSPDRPAVRSAVAVLMLFKGPVARGQADDDGAAEAPIDLADPRMLEAESHPLRSEIFSVLRDREASPSDVARQLAAPVSNASYHVRRLARLGLVEMIARREHRGAVEHYYKACVRPTILGYGWERSFAHDAASTAATSILGAARAGGFDGDDIHYTRTPFPKDRRSWAAVAAALATAGRRVEELAAAAGEAWAAQLEDVQAVTMLFERTPPAAVAGPPSSAAAPW
jgi:DNA-binding transcriptional ArsR family regulator